MRLTSNPFEITKAVDFTDAEIEATWVDLPGGGFSTLADPASPMPRFLVGGKGGGRTHLLRHFSFALQRLRHSEGLARGIQRDGYLGVYFRCGGLNSSRFSGKRQAEETWDVVFAYYMEVWFARLTTQLILTVYRAEGLDCEGAEVEAFVSDAKALFDLALAPSVEQGNSLERLVGMLEVVQRQLDIAVNNVAITQQLQVTVAASPGRLVFGVPAAAARHLPLFRNVVFAYLLDEFENLTEPQQRYVNTLIREKELPATFLIGSRRHGLRTHVTLAAGEENKQGSEYDLVVLEDAYRARAKHYAEFCRNIVRRRLQDVGIYVTPDDELNAYFDGGEAAGTTLEARAVTLAATVGRKKGHVPLLMKLEGQLAQVSAAHRKTIVSAIGRIENPLHQKLAALLFYRDWADGQDLVEAARRASDRVAHLARGEADARLLITYKHYRADLYAQLLDEYEQDQEYVGFESFVRMSGYLPRNLLVVLKQVTRWSLFLGEDPYRNPISVKAQREGVREASAWFLADAKGLGKVGEDAQLAVRRLGSLFREMRFADKPVEVSCAAFTTDWQGLSSDAATVMREAVLHNLILEIPGGRWNKNSRVLNRKYQLNPMLAPMFDLPIALRGSANLSADVLNAVFDPGVSESGYTKVLRQVKSRLEAPFKDEGSQPRLELA